MRRRQVRPRARRPGPWRRRYRGWRPVPGVRERTPGVFLTGAVVVEVVFPADESYAKLGFYFAAGVEEVVIADPERRRLEWYQRVQDGWRPCERSALFDIIGEDLAARIDWPD